MEDFIDPPAANGQPPDPNGQRGNALPDPIGALEHGALEAFEAALAAGADWRDAFEPLLASLPEAHWDALAELCRESRGAWHLLVGAGPGRALFCGHPASGTLPALAAAGWELVVLDRSPARLRFAAGALARCSRAGATAGRAHALLVGGDGDRLPLANDSVDLAILEEGPGTPPAATLAEARRVARGEVLVAVDNTLGYKRTSGRYADLALVGPLGWLGRLFRSAPAEGTLRAWRRRLAAAGLVPERALALYPHRRDFAHVADLSGGAPRLFLGPGERRNRVKTAAVALGLFPHFTPSFAFLARPAPVDPNPADPDPAGPGRGATLPPPESRIERVLAELAERLREPRPRLEHLVATRGNSAIVLTAGAQENGAGDGGPGAWALHVPLGPHPRANLARHLRALEVVRARGVPAPEPLFHGTIEGLDLGCERRLAGVASHHGLGGREGRRAHEALFAAAARDLARLVARPAAPFDGDDWETLVAARLQRVLPSLAPAARRGLERIAAEARERLVGRPVPQVLCHGDLRAKHVHTGAGGAVLGYLDWGAATARDLPLTDLVHLWVHDRKQLEGRSDGALWRELSAGHSSAAEAAAFSAYRTATGLDAEAAEALVLLYPLLVADTARRCRPHGRPGWFERHFEL